LAMTKVKSFHAVKAKLEANISNSRQENPHNTILVVVH
jgi:hypothetical protein